MNRFDTIYSKATYLYTEDTLETVGFFPGCFSPPHIGHYITAKDMASEMNHAYVIASDMCRSPITLDQMNAIWKIYIEAIGASNLSVQVVRGSPVTVVYQAVSLMNDQPDAKGKEELIDHLNPAAITMYDNITGPLPGKYEVNLFAGKEDIGGRYSAFFKEGDSKYKGNGVLNILARGVQRVASGTETRQTIGDVAVGMKDEQTLRQLLPGPTSGRGDGAGWLTMEQEDSIVNILVK